MKESAFKVGDMLVNVDWGVDSRVKNGEIGIVIDLVIADSSRDYNYIKILWSDSRKGLYYQRGLGQFKLERM